jgi:hypothetical protein
MECSEQKFKASEYGIAKINFIIAQLEKNNFAIKADAFSMSNLRKYYSENINLVSPSVFNCYEALLNFGYEGTAKEFDEYLKNQNPLGYGLDKVGTTINEIGNVFNSLIKNIPLVLTLIAVIVVTNAVKK